MCPHTCLPDLTELTDKTCCSETRGNMERVGKTTYLWFLYVCLYLWECPGCYGRTIRLGMLSPREHIRLGWTTNAAAVTIALEQAGTNGLLRDFNVRYVGWMLSRSQSVKRYSKDGCRSHIRMYLIFLLFGFGGCALLVFNPALYKHCPSYPLSHCMVSTLPIYYSDY